MKRLILFTILLWHSAWAYSSLVLVPGVSGVLKVPAVAPFTTLGDYRAEFRMHVWMNKLALADWKIALQVVDAATLPSGEMGHSRMVLPAKTATISIPDRGNYALPCEWQVDLAEAGVVHELVHIRLAPAFEVDRTERSKQAEENAVVALTMTLIDEVRR